MNKLPLARMVNRISLRFNTAPRIHRCEKKWQWDPPPLLDYDIWCVLGGEGIMTLNDCKFDLRPGTVFIFPPGCQPKGRQNMHNRLVVFAVHVDFLNRDGSIVPGEAVALPVNPVRINDLSLLEAHVREAVAFYHSGHKTTEARCQLAVWQILLQIADEAEHQPMHRPDSRIVKIARAIEEEPANEWSVPALARSAGLSRTHFTRVFAEIMGLPPNRYIILRRIERARQLLEESTLTISQIADTLSYSDVYFFSRQFKKITGSSPRSYRHQGRASGMR